MTQLRSDAATYASIGLEVHIIGFVVLLSVYLFRHHFVTEYAIDYFMSQELYYRLK